jgi:hypothetical protein
LLRSYAKYLSSSSQFSSKINSRFAFIQSLLASDRMQSRAVLYDGASYQIYLTTKETNKFSQVFADVDSMQPLLHAMDPSNPAFSTAEQYTSVGKYVKGTWYKTKKKFEGRAMEGNTVVAPLATVLMDATKFGNSEVQHRIGYVTTMAHLWALVVADDRSSNHSGTCSCRV